MGVSIVEVSPRDGLQNESLYLPTEHKLALIRSAAAAGIGRIEATAFVHPGRVPQMADAEEVVRGTHIPGLRVNGLVLNRRGAERAVASQVDEITFVILASETFNRRNQGCSRAESLAEWTEVSALCRENGIKTTFLVGAAFGCPFEGEIAPTAVIELAAAGLEFGADELALADTIGCGVPKQTTALFGQLHLIAGTTPLRAHFHNTRNTGYANALAAVDAGVTQLDSSFGGLGGCPFAPNATGNIATEDLAWILERSGIATGVDVDAAIAITRQLSDWGYSTPALLGRAGPFPSPSM